MSQSLADAVANLGRWKYLRGTRGRCLEATWWACQRADAVIAGGKTAWNSFELMSQHCGDYDYERARRDSLGRLPGEGGREGYCVVYFRSAWYKRPILTPKPGHVGILHGDTIFSDVDHAMTPAWAKRLRGAFVPQEGK